MKWFYLSLFFEIPAIIVYFGTVGYIFYKWKNLKSSFYLFFIFEFIMNILTYYNTMIAIRIPNFTKSDGFFAEYFQKHNQSDFLLQFHYSLQFHMAFIQYSTTTVVAINRMTIILNAVYFEKKWTRYSWIIMLFIVFSPLLATYEIFFKDAYYQYNESAERFDLQSKFLSFGLFNILFIFMIFTSTTTMISNVITLVKFRLLPYKPKNLEIHFFCVSLVLSFFQILGTVLTFLMKIAQPGDPLFRFTNMCLPFVSDALSLISPFAFLLFSEPYAITTIISINRLTIIWNHFIFEPLWRNYSFVLIFVVYFLPFISTGQLFSSTCTFGNRSDDTFVLSCDLPTSILFTPLIVFQVICIICSAACNVTSLVLVLRASKEIKLKMEANFFYLISVTSSVLAAGVIISFILSSYPKAPFYNFFHAYVLPFISDLFTVIHPWLLYGLCKPIRKYIHRDIFRLNSSSIDVVPHNSHAGVRPGSRIDVKF